MSKECLSTNDECLTLYSAINSSFRSRNKKITQNRRPDILVWLQKTGKNACPPDCNWSNYFVTVPWSSFVILLSFEFRYSSILRYYFFHCLNYACRVRFQGHVLLSGLLQVFYLDRAGGEFIAARDKRDAKTAAVGVF
jgi:hypothetical protein